MTDIDSSAALPTTTKVLCAAYGAIAVVALIATWSQNLAYLDRGAGFFLAFWEDTKVNAAARSITADIMLFGLAAIIFMVYEARKHGIRFVWVYVIASFFIAISVAFSVVPPRAGVAHPPRRGPADRRRERGRARPRRGVRGGVHDLDRRGLSVAGVGE